MQRFFSNMDTEESSLSFRLLEIQEYNLEEKVLFISLPICILGFLGNSVILWFLCCRVRIKLNLYFVCVAAANIMLTFSIIAEYIMFFRPLIFNLMLHRVLHVLHLCSHQVSFYIFGTITAERWCIHFFPVWYKKFRPVNFSAIVSFFLWGFTCLVSIMTHYLCSPLAEVHFKNIENCTISTILLIIGQLIFIPGVMFFSLSIWIRIHMKEEVPPRRIDITMIATVLLYLMLNVPFDLATISMHWAENIDGYILGSLNTLLESITSAISPFIYLIVGCWKKPKTKSASAFLEIALSGKTAMLVKTQTQT